MAGMHHGTVDYADLELSDDWCIFLKQHVVDVSQRRVIVTVGNSITASCTDAGLACTTQLLHSSHTYDSAYCTIIVISTYVFLSGLTTN